jgi:succinoglycan biosynthesis protein ExoM
MNIQRLAVCICTYRRPNDLRRLLTRLHSDVAALHNLAELGVVVIDDDSDLSAKPVVDGFEEQFPLGLHYTSTASGNISVARNCAVATGLPLADALAFIDDDCLPDPGWLQQLLRVQQSTGCDIVSGCCQDEPPAGSPRWLTDAPFLAGPLTLPDAATIEIGALKNTLVTTQFLEGSGVCFDPRFGTAGGEDVMWYRAAVTAGATIRYAADAVVREMIPPSRVRLPYLLCRALWYGNTEVVTGLAVGSQSRARMALSGAKCAAAAVVRPLARVARRSSPQWRFAATELLRGVGRLAGAAGVRIRHH